MLFRSEVGIIGNGAGLVMSTLDVVAYAGEEFGGVKPANFLDIGGGASGLTYTQRLDVAKGGTPGSPITISVGYACMIPQRHASPIDLIKAADQALYQAKQEGRNRTKPAGILSLVPDSHDD